jgi:hypothetical protein
LDSLGDDGNDDDAALVSLLEAEESKLAQAQAQAQQQVKPSSVLKPSASASPAPAAHVALDLTPPGTARPLPLPPAFPAQRTLLQQPPFPQPLLLPQQQQQPQLRVARPAPGPAGGEPHKASSPSPQLVAAHLSGGAAASAAAVSSPVGDTLTVSSYLALLQVCTRR